MTSSITPHFGNTDMGINHNYWSTEPIPLGHLTHGTLETQVYPQCVVRTVYQAGN